MKYSPYSFTKIDTFLTCPRKFKFYYIDKVKVPWVPQIALERGKVLHLLREFDGDVSKCKSHNDYKKLKLITPEILEELIKINDDFNASKLGQWHKNNVKQLGDEVGVALDMKLKPADFMQYYDIAKYGTTNLFQGLLDNLGVIESKDLLIINDWKSGRYPDKPKFDQLLYYAIWAFEHVPHDNILIMLTYLEHGKSHQQLLSRENLSMYKKALVNNIKTIETADEFPKEITGLCNFCDFKGLCDEQK